MMINNAGGVFSHITHLVLLAHAQHLPNKAIMSFLSSHDYNTVIESSLENVPCN